MIQAEHLSRRAGEVVLLDDVSLCIDVEQRIGLTGKSGSGKSTLLRSIALLDPLDHGTIRHHGVVVGGPNVPLYRRKVCYLDQRPAMIPGTVDDNLRLPFELVSQPLAYDRVFATEMLKKLGRSPAILDQDSGQISGGEQQSVALVRSLLTDPEVLLLDEPTASLDPGATEATEHFLKTWIDADENRSWIWSSHDADQVDRVTDRVLRMKAGRLVDE